MDRLLASLTTKQLLEWQVFYNLEPFGDRRADFHAASICSILANIAAARGRSGKRFSTRDFLLEFTDTPKAAPSREPAQPWQQMKLLAQALSQISYDEPKKGRRRGR